MKLTAKIFKSKASRSTLMRRADQVFSLYIRHRDAAAETRLPPGVGRCITCGQPTQVKGNDCGHYAGRENQATRYHEKNCHLQCRKCNRFKEGMKGRYSREIDRRYGPGTAENLEQLARTFCKRDRFDFMVIIDEYTQKTEAICHLKAEGIIPQKP